MTAWSLENSVLGCLKRKEEPDVNDTATAKSLQSCLTLCDPIDSSPPGFPVPGILQARILEWVAISFSNSWKWKVKVKSPSCVQPSVIPWTAALQAPPSMGFSRQEYWSGLPLPSPWMTLLIPNGLKRSKEYFPIMFPKTLSSGYGISILLAYIDPGWLCSNSTQSQKKTFLHIVQAHQMMKLVTLYFSTSTWGQLPHIVNNSAWTSDFLAVLISWIFK